MYAIFYIVVFIILILLFSFYFFFFFFINPIPQDLYFFFFNYYLHHRDLHSFPTRRSSDLIGWAYFNRAVSKVYLGQEAQAEADVVQCLKLRPELKAQLEKRVDLARHLRRISKQD